MSEQATRREQYRTTAHKKLLLAVLSMTKGNITQACERARISRDTYYDWRRKDHAFAKEIETIGMESMGYFLNEIKKEFPDF